LCDRLGAAPDSVAHAAAHRWRYARVTQALGQPFLRSADATLYLAATGASARGLRPPGPAALPWPRIF
jgi:predicted NAD/FAD-dependent oxidoreductase